MTCQLTKDELEEIARRSGEIAADAISDKWQKNKPAFWIQPQQHYDEHVQLRSMWADFNSTNKIIRKAITGLILLGLGVSVLIGLASLNDLKQTANYLKEQPTQSETVEKRK
jgi:hypothetical protein